MAAAREVKRHATSGEGINILVARAIYILFAVIATLIAVRIVLLAIGVGTDNICANFIYSVTSVLLAPFFFVFGYTPTYGAPVFEISALIGLLVYILLGWALAFWTTYGSWHSDNV